MWLLVSLLAFDLSVQSELRVEIRDSEVWLIRGASEAQLTHDLKAKPQVLLSPSQSRIAYFEQCPEDEHCTPTIVVLDLQGHRIGSVQPQLQVGDSTEPCASILSIRWNGDEAIAADCHIHPSLGNYIETQIATGKTVRYLAGYFFTPSPDGKRVAHVGWIVHFAPPWAQSNYLQIEHTTIYPLPEGTGPTEQKGLELAPKVVRQQGLLFSGIHDFTPGFSWSPDS